MERGGHLSIKFLVSTIVLLTASLCQSQLLAEKFSPKASKSLAQILNIGSNGDRGCLHTFREVSPGLTSHRDVVKGQRALPTTSHDLTFVVQQRNMDQLTRILHDVSDPASENYGNHLTKKEVIDLTSNPDSNNAVVAYLQAAGADITLVEHGGSSITARGQISLWERMLNTEFYSYSLPSKMIDGELQSNTNTIHAHEFVRTEKYSVPLHLDKHVAFVMNTVQLPQFRSTKVPVTKIESVDTAKSSKFSEETVLYQGYVTPQLLNNAYGIEDNTGHPQATQAAYETGGQVFSPQDLATFQKDLKLPIRPASETIGNMTVTSKWCRENGYSICAESNLDMMYMLAMADTPTITYYSSERMSWFLVTVLYSPRPPPLVISISYTSEERYVSRGEAATLEDAVKILGVMGVTVLASAGDDGVSPVPARLDASRCGYVPLYPASCPYIVSVGATQGVEAFLPESVCQNDRGGGITSGGGISILFPTPSWQKSHMHNYFLKVNGTAQQPYPGHARGGRGYPDLAMAGSKFVFIIGGHLVGGGGTSVATPVLAGMISLINAARFRAGGKPVGWINSILYDYGSKFMNDITVGDNHCTALSICCKQGFFATPGWDPASGLGSLNFKRFKAFMMDISIIAKIEASITLTRPPTRAPTTMPTITPTRFPTWRPTTTPTSSPTPSPSTAPSVALTAYPTPSPSTVPSNLPTANPTPSPSTVPSNLPTANPTPSPSTAPSVVPTANPTPSPSTAPSVVPTANPTPSPSTAPSTGPTANPIPSPVAALNVARTTNPIPSPSTAPSNLPTANPTPSPSTAPSNLPTANPTPSPSTAPSTVPTANPTPSPSTAPSTVPTANPTPSPSIAPSTSQPTESAVDIGSDDDTSTEYYDSYVEPTARPTRKPSRQRKPTRRPSRTKRPTRSPQMDDYY